MTFGSVAVALDPGGDPATWKGATADEEEEAVGEVGTGRASEWVLGPSEEEEEEEG